MGILSGIFLSSDGLASANDCPDCPGASSAVTAPDSQILNGNPLTLNQYKIDPRERLDQKKKLQENRKDAAEKMKKSFVNKGKTSGTSGIMALMPGPGSVPDYFGVYPNYATSPLPVGNATVTFTGAGTGAAATATVAANGVVTGITLTNGGTGYTSAPAVIINGDGTGATAAAALTPSAVASIALTAGGSGYTSAPTITISDPTGTGATATATVTGPVTGIALTNGGSGYTAPTVAITGDGTPDNLTAAPLYAPMRVSLTWTDNSTDEINFSIQRATDAGFTTGLTTFTVAGSANGAIGGTFVYTDTTAVLGTQYYYRVMATNVVGAPNIGAYPTYVVNSVPSSTATAQLIIEAPVNLRATIISSTLVRLNWTDNSTNELSFAVYRSDNGSAFVQIGTVPRTPAQSLATGGLVSFDNTNAVASLVPGHTYSYYVIAVNGTIQSLPSNTTTVAFVVPAAPSGLTGTAVRISGNLFQDRVTLTG